MFVYISCLIKVASFWSLEVASRQLLYNILVLTQLSKAINATSVSNHVTFVSYTSATYIKTNLVVHGLLHFASASMKQFLRKNWKDVRFPYPVQVKNLISVMKTSIRIPVLGSSSIFKNYSKTNH